jgi:hypothetical protein
LYATTQLPFFMASFLDIRSLSFFLGAFDFKLPETQCNRPESETIGNFRPRSEFGADVGIEVRAEG